MVERRTSPATKKRKKRKYIDHFGVELWMMMWIFVLLHRRGVRDIFSI